MMELMGNTFVFNVLFDTYAYACIELASRIVLVASVGIHLKEFLFFARIQQPSVSY